MGKWQMGDVTARGHFDAAKFGLLRLSVYAPGRASSTMIDIDPEDPHNAERMTEYVRQLIADPVFREALQVSSLSLNAVLDRIESGQSVPFSRLRRAVYTVTKYLLRMSYRPTPFGLMAGVTLVEFGQSRHFRLGPTNHKSVRPDIDWLLRLLTKLERQPEVLSHLHVVHNDLVVVRGDRLILPYVRGSDTRTKLSQTQEKSIIYTDAVRGAMELTLHPVKYPELVSKLLLMFCEAPKWAVIGMLDKLLEEDFLLTDLHPSQDSTDPLGHAVDRLTSIAELPQVSLLREIQEAIGDYAACPPGGGALQLRSLVSTMSRAHVSEQPLQVDLRIDAEVGIPDVVVGELERVADMLWRITPDLTPSHLREYHSAFLSRYGTECTVPIKELIDSERGLGPPAGYYRPPSARRAAHQRLDRDHPARKRALAALALGAHWDSAGEVVIEDSLVSALAGKDVATQPPPAFDLGASLLANSLESVTAGDFRLVLSTSLWSSEPGAVFGRFFHLVPGTADRVGELISQPHVAGAGAVPAQVLCQPEDPRHGNVTMVPTTLPYKVVIGAYADRSDEHVLGLDDLTVAADNSRLFVLSTSLRREIVPMFFHMLNPVYGLPNAARLLGEIALFRRRQLGGWRWSGLEQLPHLPRVRYGRTVLYSARWLPDPVLQEGLPYEQWQAVLRSWRQRWKVPDIVEITFGDHRIIVDLNVPLHQRVLWRELRRQPTLVLTEVPAGGEFGTGWCANHANEIVVPVTPRMSTLPPAVPPSGIWPAPRRQHHPGGEWLYAKLYLTDEHQDEMLVDYFPELLEQLAGLTDRWFFLRFQDPDPHLRLRVHAESSTAVGLISRMVHDWVSAACDAGRMQKMVLDTYEPEYSRYGGENLLNLAERAFHADSQSALAQLRQRQEGQLTIEPILLAAANYVDLARRMGDGNDWIEWFLGHYPKAGQNGAFRSRRAEACRLIDPSGAWTGLKWRAWWGRAGGRVGTAGAYLRRVRCRAALAVPVALGPPPHQRRDGQRAAHALQPLARRQHG